MRIHTTQSLIRLLSERRTSAGGTHPSDHHDRRRPRRRSLARRAAAVPRAAALPGLQLQASITNAAGSAFDTQEEAAIGALETVFDIDVDRVLLIPAEPGRFRARSSSMTVLDRPPVSMHRSGSGFQSDRLVC